MRFSQQPLQSFMHIVWGKNNLTNDKWKKKIMLGFNGVVLVVVTYVNIFIIKGNILLRMKYIWALKEISITLDVKIHFSYLKSGALTLYVYLSNQFLNTLYSGVILFELSYIQVFRKYTPHSTCISHRRNTAHSEHVSRQLGNVYWNMVSTQWYVTRKTFTLYENLCVCVCFLIIFYGCKKFFFFNTLLKPIVKKFFFTWLNQSVL